MAAGENQMLRLLAATGVLPEAHSHLQGEVEQLMRIPGAIIVSSKAHV